jgi:hypothetical protein
VRGLTLAAAKANSWTATDRHPSGNVTRWPGPEIDRNGITDDCHVTRLVVISNARILDEEMADIESGERPALRVSAGGQVPGPIVPPDEIKLQVGRVNLLHGCAAGDHGPRQRHRKPVGTKKRDRLATRRGK